MQDNPRMNLRKSFSVAAASYDKAAALAREVGLRMLARLDCVRLKPTRMADIGCATGDGIHALMRRYPDALPLAVDFARPMLDALRARSGWWERLRGKAPRCVNADVRALPLQSDSLDLVWSNLMLHWLPDLRPACDELQRVLRIGGLLHFSLLGPDTLKELREGARALGLPWRGKAFLDMHDVGDLLMMSGFADPVMEMEMLTLTYRTPRAFLADQRRLGVRDGLLGPLDWRTARRLLAAWPKAEGLLPARFEIIYGHAWKLTPRKARDGRAVMHFHRAAS